MTDMTTPRIYVGTYAKYNNGSIAGQWLDLENYADKEDFLKACAELHKDEADPEFMFQDFEGFPRALYNESYIDEKLFDWLELDEDDRELLEVYQDEVNQDGDIDEAREAFAGKFDRKIDWAYDWLESMGDLDQIPEHLRNYFDYEAYLRDWEINGDITFAYHNGEYWAFRRY